MLGAERLLLFSDDVSYGIFAVGRESIQILLSSTGDFFLISDATGSRTHLTRYAPTKLRPYVQIVLNFRNHFCSVPYLCECFHGCEAFEGEDKVLWTCTEMNETTKSGAISVSSSSPSSSPPEPSSSSHHGWRHAFDESKASSVSVCPFSRRISFEALTTFGAVDSTDTVR
jgi:hypothetical protein